MAGDADRTVHSIFCGRRLVWCWSGNGTVKQYLPDAHADFIFSVAAEEYGLMACLLLIGAYSFVVIRGYAQSLNRPDMFTILAVSGLTTQFGYRPPFTWPLQ